MNPEKYWAQTRAKWQARVVDPDGESLACGFCNFVNLHLGGSCKTACPVVAVYGHGCSRVGSVGAYVQAYYHTSAGVEELRALARAVVYELDDKKEEFIAAMRKLVGVRR